MTGSAKSCAVAAVTQVPGTRYTPSVSNVLGTMFGTTVTADKKGSLWVFGGSNNSSNYNTLWRYSESTNLWTWMAGSGSISGTGTGGVIGAELATYTPPAVVYPATTADESGNIWLFGGSGTSYNQNGLWRFNTTTNMWALMGGTASAAGIIYSVRGNSGVESATYTPGARYNSAMWYDEHGYIWIFGGTGYSTASVGYLNDLWRYNIATQQWAWISGSPTTADATGSSMGTQNQINSNNIIGSRRGIITIMLISLVVLVTTRLVLVVP